MPSAMTRELVGDSSTPESVSVGAAYRRTSVLSWHVLVSWEQIKHSHSYAKSTISTCVVVLGWSNWLEKRVVLYSEPMWRFSVQPSSLTPTTCATHLR